MEESWGGEGLVMRDIKDEFTIIWCADIAFHKCCIVIENINIIKAILTLSVSSSQLQAT